MIANTYICIENIDASIIESAKVMGSTSFEILYKVKFPLATIVILSSLRNMVVMTISLSGIASFILCEMIGLLIEDGTDLEVEITKGIGGAT